jgi:hypothetical protein
MKGASVPAGACVARALLRCGGAAPFTRFDAGAAAAAGATALFFFFATAGAARGTGPGCAPARRRPDGLGWRRAMGMPSMGSGAAPRFVFFLRGAPICSIFVAGSQTKPSAVSRAHSAGGLAASSGGHCLLNLAETGPLSQGVQAGRKALSIRHIKGMEAREKRPRGFK